MQEFNQETYGIYSVRKGSLYR